MSDAPLSDSWSQLVASKRPGMAFHLVCERYPTDMPSPDAPEAPGTISVSIPKREGFRTLQADWSEVGYVWVTFVVDGPSPLKPEEP